MNNAVSAPIRKLAAVSLALALAWLIAGGLVMPLARSIVDDRARIETQRELLGRLSDGIQSVAATEGEVRSGAAAMQRKLLLEGDTEAVQLAKLQSLLREAVTAERTRVQSLRTVPTQSVGDLDFAGAQVSFHATMVATQRILHRLETTEPILLVKALDITPLSASAARASGEEDGLRVEIRVVAAVRQRTGAAP